MKLLVMFFLAFAMTFGGVLAVMKPELLSWTTVEQLAGSEKAPPVEQDSAESDLPQQAAKAKKKRRTRKRRQVREEEDDFDRFMENFGSGGSLTGSTSGSQRAPGGLSTQRQSALPLKASGWKNSSPLSVASLRGNIIVLKFWATWCPPCLRAIPHDNEIQQHYGNRGVVVIGVCTGSQTEKMGAIANSKGIRYPIVQDLNSRTSDDYGIEAYPTYVVIDRNGNVAFPRCKKRDVEDAIEYLLRE